MVRTNVAKSELTFSTPTLAKIAVSAANTAERTAQNCQDEKAVGAIAFSIIVPAWRRWAYVIAFAIDWMRSISSIISTL